MKAINKIFTIKNLNLIMPVLFAVFFSCGNGSEILDSTDVQNINSVSVSSAFFSESSEITNNVFRGLATTQYAGARVAGELVQGLSKFDGRLSCAVVTITRTGTLDNPSGIIMVNYDSSIIPSTCTDSAGVKRRGKIIVTYSGKKWAVGSYVKIQLQNFYRNYAHIEGSLYDSITQAPDTTHLQFLSKLDNGKITFGDGRSVTRTANLTRVWYRSLIRDNNKWVVSGQATEQNNDGASYQLQIENSYPLVYRVACFRSKIFIPVSGKEDVLAVNSAGHAEYTIDFGDNTCDDLVTVTVGGKEKVIPVSQNGN